MADVPHAPQAAPARRWTAERWARIGITIQFLAIIRTLAEVYRLRHAAGGGMEFVYSESYVTGGIIATVFCWIAVTLYFFRRFRASVVVAALMVVALLAFKLAVIGA
jgi:hypothetical protein